MAETGSLAFAAVVTFAFLMVWGSVVCTQTQFPHVSDIEVSLEAITTSSAQRRCFT